MSRLRQINRIKHCFDKHTLITIVNALLLSKLFYCSTVWNNTSEANLSKIQAVQSYASGARKYDHVTPIFFLKQLNWLSVRQHLYYRDSILAFKCMTGSAPDYLSEQFIRRGDVSTRITRNSQMLNTPLFKTATGQRTFYYRTVSLWNSLPPELKTTECVAKFKRLLRRRLGEVK